jgi:site-specific DNA recombinase
MEKRPAGREMLRDAQAGKFDMVLVYSIGRLARTVLAGAQCVRDLQKRYGIGFRSAKEPVDTTSPYGWYMFLSFLNLFELERNIILERTDIGRNRILDEGRWPGGKPLYGYRIDKTGRGTEAGVLVVYEPEAQVVRRIHLWARDGWSCNRIAKQLTAEGVPVPHPNRARSATHRWHHRTVSRIIKETAYVGQYLWGKTFGIREEGEYLGRERVTDIEQLVPVTVPAIVTREEWEAANARVAINRAMSQGNGKRTYLLRGLVQCGVEGCCRNYTGAHRVVNRQGDKAPFYGCRSLWVKPPCANVRVSATELEEAVKREVLAFLADPTDALRELAASLQAEADALPPIEDELAAAEARLAELEEEKKRIQSGHRAGVYNDQEAADALREIRESLSLAQSHALFLESQGRPDWRETVADTAGLLLELREELAGATDETWREALELVVEAVVIYPEKVAGQAWPMPRGRAILRLGGELSAIPRANVQSCARGIAYTTAGGPVAGGETRGPGGRSAAPAGAHEGGGWSCDTGLSYVLPLGLRVARNRPSPPPQKREQFACQQCGHLFEKRPSDVKNHERACCSIRCANRLRVEVQRRREHRECAQCGKLIVRRPSEFPQVPERTYCSQKCNARARVERLTRERAA